MGLVVISDIKDGDNHLKNIIKKAISESEDIITAAQKEAFLRVANSIYENRGK